MAPFRLSYIVATALLALGLGAGCYAGTYGHASVGVNAGPPPASDIYYADRDGYVWVEGRYLWTGADWQWRPGYWMAARPGYVYTQGYWYDAGGQWSWYSGGWVRQRPGQVYVRGYWDTRSGRRAWVRGRWARQRPGQHYQRGRWTRQGDRRVYRQGRWRPGAAPRAYGHRRGSRGRVTPHRSRSAPSSRGVPRSRRGGSGRTRDR